MSDTDNATTSREDRIAELQAELEALTSETAEEVQTVLSDAEEAVTEVAEGHQEALSDAHETIGEAEHEVEAEVQEQAQEAAESLGHPELADQIAEGLFQRLHDAGLLPHTQHHEVSPVSESEHVAEETAEVVEAAPAEVEHIADTPPEPVHWWYRDRHLPRFRRN